MTLSRRILCILAIGLFSIGLYAQETGKADIFSDEFQGSWTASKTTYNKDEFVAAHKSYEFGTILKVMVAGQDKAINVRVVDRGPFKFGYVVTLSRAAATELGLKEDDKRDVVILVAREQGLATVAPATTVIQPSASTVVTTPAPAQSTQTITTTTTTPQPTTTYIAPTTTIIQPAQEFVTKGQTTNIEVGTRFTEVPANQATETVVMSNPAPAVTMTSPSTTTVISSSNIGYGLQVGSFLDYNNAVIEMTNLRNKNIHNLVLNTVTDNAGKQIHKLVIGPFADRVEVEQYKVVAPNSYNSKAFIVDLSKMK